MVIKYKHGDFMIEHTVDSYRKLFAFIKDISDTLHWEPCGLCQSEEVERQVRESSEGDPYYELACRACGAKLQFTSRKKDGAEGALFPRRYDYKKRVAIPNNGWVKFERADSDDDYTPIDDAEPVTKKMTAVEWLAGVADDSTVKKLRAAAIEADVALSALYDHLAEKFATDDEPPSSDELLMEATRWIKTR